MTDSSNAAALDLIDRLDDPITACSPSIPFAGDPAPSRGDDWIPARLLAPALRPRLKHAGLKVAPGELSVAIKRHATLRPAQGELAIKRRRLPELMRMIGLLPPLSESDDDLLKAAPQAPSLAKRLADRGVRISLERVEKAIRARSLDPHPNTRSRLITRADLRDVEAELLSEK